jgi:hypothetical protein
MYFVNFSSADAAVKIIIGEKLEIFNEGVREIEAARIHDYVDSLLGDLEGKREGEEPAQREMRRPKKMGGERYQPIGILMLPGTK